MRAFLAALTYITSLLVVGGIVLVIVLVVAGPHAGLLPRWLESVVLALGWVAVFLLPMVPTHWVWRRLAPRRSASDRG